MTDRLLLVGATGFLGSAVAARLADRQPIALVRSSSDRSMLPTGMVQRVGDLAEPLPFADLVRTAAKAVGRRILLLRVPLEAAVVAARLTRVVTPEQIRRLAEDKTFPITEAARDFNFAPRSFADGVRLEAISLGLTRS